MTVPTSLKSQTSKVRLLNHKDPNAIQAVQGIQKRSIGSDAMIRSKTMILDPLGATKERDAPPDMERKMATARSGSQWNAPPQHKCLCCNSVICANEEAQREALLKKARVHQALENLKRHTPHYAGKIRVQMKKCSDFESESRARIVALAEQSFAALLSLEQVGVEVTQQVAETESLFRCELTNDYSEALHCIHNEYTWENSQVILCVEALRTYQELVALERNLYQSQIFDCATQERELILGVILKEQGCRIVLEEEQSNECAQFMRGLSVYINFFEKMSAAVREFLLKETNKRYDVIAVEESQAMECLMGNFVTQRRALIEILEMNTADRARLIEQEAYERLCHDRKCDDEFSMLSEDSKLSWQHIIDLLQRHAEERASVWKVEGVEREEVESSWCESLRGLCNRLEKETQQCVEHCRAKAAEVASFFEHEMHNRCVIAGESDVILSGLRVWFTDLLKFVLPQHMQHVAAVYVSSVAGVFERTYAVTREAAWTAAQYEWCNLEHCARVALERRLTLEASEREHFLSTEEPQWRVALEQEEALLFATIQQSQSEEAAAYLRFCDRIHAEGCDLIAREHSTRSGTCRFEEEERQRLHARLIAEEEALTHWIAARNDDCMLLFEAELRLRCMLCAEEEEKRTNLRERCHQTATTLHTRSFLRIMEALETDYETFLREQILIPEASAFQRYMYAQQAEARALILAERAVLHAKLGQVCDEETDLRRRIGLEAYYEGGKLELLEQGERRLAQKRSWETLKALRMETLRERPRHADAAAREMLPLSVVSESVAVRAQWGAVPTECISEDFENLVGQTIRALFVSEDGTQSQVTPPQSSRSGGVMRAIRAVPASTVRTVSSLLQQMQQALQSARVQHSCAQTQFEQIRKKHENASRDLKRIVSSCEERDTFIENLHQTGQAQHRAAIEHKRKEEQEVQIQQQRILTLEQSLTTLRKSVDALREQCHSNIMTNWGGKKNVSKVPPSNAPAPIAPKKAIQHKNAKKKCTAEQTTAQK